MRRYPVRRPAVQRSHVRRPRMRRSWWHRSWWHRSRMNRSWMRGPARDRTAGNRTAGNRTAGNRAAGNRAARDRATRWRRGWRPAPAVAVLVLGRPGRTVMTTRGTARCTRTRRPEKAVPSRWHPPPVRQPAAPAGPAAIRWYPVVHGPVRPVRKAAVRPAGMRPGHRRRGAIRPRYMRCSGIRPGDMRSGGTAWPAARPRSVPPAIGITAIRVPAVCVSGIGVPAVRVPAIRVSAVLIPAVRASRGAATRPLPLRPRPLRSLPLRSRPLWPGVTGTARGHARREPARLAWLPRIGPPRFTRPRRTRRRLARTAWQLSVVVLAEVGRPAGAGRILILGGDGITLVRGVGSSTVATAIALASRQTVRVTAEAGVATFHQIPPGPRCPAMTRDACPYPLSVGRQKSPV